MKVQTLCAGKTRDNVESNFYYFEPKELLESILINDKQIAKMTFLSVSSSTSQEVFHSNIFRQSPLFGFQKVLLRDESTLSMGDAVEIHNEYGRVEGFSISPVQGVGAVEVHVRVAINLDGTSRYYLTDRVVSTGLDGVRVSPSLKFEGSFKSTLYEQQQKTLRRNVPKNDFIYDELPILWHYQTEAAPEIPDNMPVLKVFIHLFVDAFGALNRQYHSTGGVYLNLGNMPRTERLKIENMYLHGLAQPGNLT